MRLAFAGTPPFAAEALQALHGAGHSIPLVLTQPDRPAGRGLKLQASAVKQTALALGLPLIQPRSLKLDGRWPDDARQAREALLGAAPEVMVVAAYGLILPRWTLELPPQGCLNIHGSLLPRWRGAAPIQRAIEAGDAQTGITIMQMDEGLDTGEMLLIGHQPITEADSAAALHDRLASQGAQLIVEALAHLAQGTLVRTPQPEQGVTYAHKIDKAESAIDWHADAAEIDRRVRAFDPFPGASFVLDGEAVKLWLARPRVEDAPHGQTPGTVLQAAPGEGLILACGRGRLELLELQAPGGRRQPAASFLQTAIGRRLVPGTVLQTATR